MPDDAFDTLGLPPSFDVDPAQIRQAFLRRAARVHPDRDHADDASEDTAALNRARAILDDPERRAIELLRRFGGPGSEERSLPDGFLIEMMEMREAVEAAVASGDAAARAHWNDVARRQREAYIESVRTLFRSIHDDPRPETRLEIRRTLNAWRYVERLIEQFDARYDPPRSDTPPRL